MYALTLTRMQRGVTLIEVMMVVSITAVLMALAAPSFTPIIESWRVRQAAEGLQATLYFARSEAIKRSGNVSIRKEPTGTNGCALAINNADWDCGWFVFVDTNNNGDLNTGEVVLQRFATPANVSVTRTGGAASIKLNRWGLVDGTWLGFNLVPLGKATSNPSARGLCMTSGGRIRIIHLAETTCNNG